MRDDTYTPDTYESGHYYRYESHIRLEKWQNCYDHKSHTPEDIDDRVISNLEWVEKEESVWDEENKEDNSHKKIVSKKEIL